MPSLRDIKKRITSVKNTQKITKAMKMVAAAKLRRAQESILAARPYAVEMEAVLTSLAARTGGAGGDETHPLLEVREPRRVELVVLTSDRGLAGAFNSNVLRRAQRFLSENQGKLEQIELSTLGRKGRDFARRRNVAMRKDYPGIFDGLSYHRAEDIAKEIIGHYLGAAAKLPAEGSDWERTGAPAAGATGSERRFGGSSNGAQLDQVFLLYNEFGSAISQKTKLTQILPVVPREPAKGPDGKPVTPTDYLYEPSRKAVLDALVPRYVAMQIWRAMLESQASEFGARMTAMDSASKNAGKLIGSLTLDYNRARQAYITKELMEIVSGAEALK